MIQEWHHILEMEDGRIFTSIDYCVKKNFWLEYKENIKTESAATPKTKKLAPVVTIYTNIKIKMDTL